jgi:hypothetical protein
MKLLFCLRPLANYLPGLLMEAMMVDHTAEIATLKQKLAAAEARGMGRHNAPESDKDKIKLLPSRKSEKAKSNPMLDEPGCRSAACRHHVWREGSMARNAHSSLVRSLRAFFADVSYITCYRDCSHCVLGYADHFAGYLSGAGTRARRLRWLVVGRT